MTYKKSIIAVVLGVFVVGSLFFVYQAVKVPKDVLHTQQYSFTVAPGENVFQIAKHLEQEGFIRSRIGFDIYVLAKGMRSDLKAGVYSLSSSMTVSEIAEKISSGGVLFTTIQTLEGWTAQDIALYLEENNIVTQEEFLYAAGFGDVVEKNAVLRREQQFSFLKDKPTGQNLEGYLFPDTYRVNNEVSADAIVEIMLQNFDAKVNSSIQEELRKQKKSLFAVVTMASILEREVQSKEDKRTVAGILWKRIEYGMPLQVDTTEMYDPGFYDTYAIQGLPAGPISNPGLESIKAALFPIETSYWYYLSTPEGVTIFSETLERHNINKVKYLR